MMTKMKTGSAPADPDGAAPTEEEKSPGSKTSYECRFCLMKFEKSQALGGHMNRHRQEREKEQYQQAQELLNSLAQQQMPRNWPSLTAEIPQLPSDPALSRMGSQFTGGATRPHAPPPISFGSYNRGVQAPTSVSIPSSVSSLSTNYYVPSNSSSCNNNVQQQQQNQHWNADGYSTAAAARSAANFQSVEISASLQARGVPPEVFASMLRASATNSHNSHHKNSHNSHHNNSHNNNDRSLVSSGTPTSTPQAPYDMYSLLPTYFGGM